VFFLKAGVYGTTLDRPLREILSNCVPLFIDYIPYEKSAD
jgi:hypothetical protein